MTPINPLPPPSPTRTRNLKPQGNSSDERAVSRLHVFADVVRHSTRSVSGSVVQEYFENGRRYCSQDYYMPDDDEEQTRLAITHQAYLPILDGHLTLGAIPRSAKRILDIGTSTGDWAIAVAERFPQAQVFATDITNTFQPSIAPANLFFELDDAQKEWTYTEPFDFIHLRGLTGAFRDWTAIYKETSKHLRIGGTCEIADIGLIELKDGPKDSYVGAYNGAVLAAADVAGTPVGLAHLEQDVLETAGLSVAKSRRFDVSLGVSSSDPKKKSAGKMLLISALEGLEATSLRLLTQRLAWSAEDVKALCQKVKEEVMRPEVNALVPVQFMAARRLM